MNLTIFAYRTIPVTLLVSSIYFAIFTALFITDSVPEIPQDTHGLDVERAYADLHTITSYPHPYHSHANDIVRKFLLSRVAEIAAGCAYAHVEEDTNTTAFMKGGLDAVVFQSSNILVKIDGYDDKFMESGGVLFSAHYDSVSTAPGATDDGIAVVSLLQFIEHLVKNRPRRTAIFNINNGEEDGLYGARAFVRHPWVRIADSFINLEGAGAGGPPLLFRASSIEPVKAFARGIATNSTTYRVRRPHGNVLSADAFSRGVVRSGTDYSVYVGDSEHKLEGVDLAFYKHRSRYHTMQDSIPGVRGKAKEALWAMLESVWGAGGVLLNIESPRSETAKLAVFFDLFKSYFIVFELGSLQIFNLVLLFAGPFLVLFLHALLPFFCGHFSVEVEENRPSIFSRMINIFRHPSREPAEDSSSRSILVQPFVYVAKMWSWGNFWIPAAMFFPATVLYVLTLMADLGGNRYVTYSQQNAVLMQNLSVSLIVIIFMLGSPSISSRLRGRRTNQVYILPDRQAILLHVYMFTYLLLIFATLAVTFELGGLYWISAWHAGVCAACIVGGIETFVARSQRVKGLQKKKRRHLLNRDANRASRNGASGGSSDSDESDEMTPLLPGSLTLPDQNGESPLVGKDNSAWWILQVLLTVPIPVVLIGHVSMLLQTALGQTLADGSSAAFVYIVQALLCFFMVLPVAPFASGIHRYVTYIATIAFLSTLIFNLVAFPFSHDTPLKVFFQQSVHLNSTNSDLTMSSTDMVEGEVISAVTSLTGVPEVIESQLVSQLPSSWGKEPNCETDKTGRWTDLVTCSWESGADVSMIPYPGGRPKHPWLSVSTQRLSPTKAWIRVEGKNTRACRFYFDQTLIVQVSLTPETGTPIVALYPTYQERVSGTLQYWTREWGKAIDIEVDFNEFVKVNGTNYESEDVLSNLRGRVACEWSEYESGMVGLDLNEISGMGYLNPRIPALEETLRFLPHWVAVSKAGDGLVEAWSEFEF